MSEHGNAPAALTDATANGTVREVPCHEVDEQLLDRALADIRKMTRGYAEEIYEQRLITPSLLEWLCRELLDHLGARTLKAPATDDAPLAKVLLTAAECAYGVLDSALCPESDFELPLPLVAYRFDDEDHISRTSDIDVTVGIWLDAFALCVVSGLVWERRRAIGLMLQDDFAWMVRKAVSRSEPSARSGPAELAEMDALRVYLASATGHLPSDWPKVPLRKPDIGERAEAIRALDAVGVGASSPDQRLLRVLLQDDREAFEEALAERLDRYREERAAEADPAPRSLLPLGTIALAALAGQVHGWAPLRVRSDYLPEFMLNASEGIRP